MADLSHQELRDLATAVRSRSEDWRTAPAIADVGFGLRGVAALIDVCLYALLALLLCLVVSNFTGLGSTPLEQARQSWVLQITILAGAVVYLSGEVVFGFS